jgi:hypothetical protein
MFHVQTEDSGIQNPHLTTELFHEGVIIAVKKLQYDAEADAEIVKGLMQAQHKAVMKELRAGLHDEKIAQYLGKADESTLPIADGGGAMAEPEPVPTEVAPDEAAMTVPTPPPIEIPEERSEASSLPYSQFLVAASADEAVVAGTLHNPSPLEDDEEINGLLSRLREETPPPEPMTISPVPLLDEDKPGTWLVSRPGQKERPFDRSGPIPIALPREEAGRRHVTPPQLDISALSPPVTPSGFAPRPQGKTTMPRPPVSVGPSSSTPQVEPPRRTTLPSQPVPPVAPQHRATGPQQVVRPPPPPLPPLRSTVTVAPPRPPAGPAPVLRSPPRTTAPAAPAPARPPVGAPVPPRLPAGTASLPRAPSPPTAPMRPQPVAPAPRPGAPARAGQPAAPRRPPSESVVVARPAVVIGAPPTVVGAPDGPGSHRRGHGRETTPPVAQADGIFGQDLISEKSLDEVIMAYLSEDAGED